MSTQDDVPLDERKGNECDATGCGRSIVGLDDIHPSEVVKAFPNWEWDGERLLCPTHAALRACRVWNP